MLCTKIVNGLPTTQMVNGTINGDVPKESSHPTETDRTRYTYESLQETVQYIRKQVPFAPEFGIICGSGLGSLADCLDDRIEIPYSTIPHFPQSTVKGHVGSLVFGHFSGIPTVCMKGRFHYYEGYPLWKCCMPIRVMKLLGVTHLFVTNAAGGLNPKFRVGDIMLVKDHINIMGFAGNNPLQGPNDERFGPRFPPMNQAYNRRVLGLAREVSKDMKIEDKIHEGVYTCLGGPNFETVAELNMLKMLDWLNKALMDAEMVAKMDDVLVKLEGNRNMHEEDELEKLSLANWIWVETMRDGLMEKVEKWVNEAKKKVIRVGQCESCMYFLLEDKLFLYEKMGKRLCIECIFKL